MKVCLFVCVYAGWEPFIEPWPCVLNWQQQAAGRLHPSRLKLGVQAKQRLDMNITSVLLGSQSGSSTLYICLLFSNCLPSYL